MKIYLNLFFLFLSTNIFSQEYVRHELSDINSLEIFEIDETIHHIYNKCGKSLISKTNLTNFTYAEDEISFAAFLSQLIYHSKDSVDVYLNQLNGGDHDVPGFAAYQNHHEIETKIDDYINSAENTFDACPITQNKYIVNSLENSSIYYYNQENESTLEANASQPITDARMFRKTDTEYYLTSDGSTYLATIDPNNEGYIEFEKIFDQGDSNARWISNTLSFGFIENESFFIVNIASGNITKWIDGISESVKDYYFTQEALYITTNTNEVIKYTSDTTPLQVFSQANLNSSIDIHIGSLFVENNSLIIGGSTSKFGSPWTIQIQENEMFDNTRPNLTISDAICYTQESEDNLKIHDCTYTVTNTGDVPVTQFSVYAMPEMLKGLYSYELHQVNSEPLQPNASMEIEIHKKSYNDAPKELFIEGANHLLLGKLATTDVKQVVSTKNVKNEPSISIFPNPSRDYFYIKGALPNSQYTLINSNGQILKKGELIDDRIEIADLENGTYFIQLWHNNKMTIMEGVKM